MSFVVDLESLPAGVTIRGGMIHPLTGEMVFDASNLGAMTLIPPANFSGEISFALKAISTEMAGDRRVEVKSVTVQIDPVSDGPTILVQSSGGHEDQAIQTRVEISLPDADGSEQLSGAALLVSGLPDGAVLNIGVQGAQPGTWVIPAAHLVVTATHDSGDPVAWEVPGLAVTPPPDAHEDFTLAFSMAGGEEGGRQLLFTADVQVDLTAVADAPTLTVANAVGSEDQLLRLTGFTAALRDLDGSEALSVVIAGAGNGVFFDDTTGQMVGTDNGDGSWTFMASELNHLSLAMPVDWSGGLNLTATAFAMEAENLHTAQTVARFQVSFASVADPPVVTVLDAAGREDTAIPLDILASTTDIDGSETLHITISGVPEGAILSHGSRNPDGSWSLTNGDLEGLTITPSGNHATDFSLSVAVQSVDPFSGAVSAPTVVNLDVQVQAVDDASVLAVRSLTGYGQMNTSGVRVAPNIQLTDVDSTSIHGAVVRIASGLQTGDVLSFDGYTTIPLGGGVFQISGTNIQFTNASGTLTLSGSDTLANYEAVLESVKLASTREGSRTFTFQVLGPDGAASDVQSVETIITKAMVQGSNTNADTMTGTTGNDGLAGLGGNDTISGGDGHDMLVGGEGHDLVQGGSGQDYLQGDAGNDTLQGDAGQDILTGGAGNDTLDGGAGNDVLMGNDGNDIFILRAGGGSESVQGGMAGGWIDSVRLEGADPAPSVSLANVGNWTMETNSDYTVVSGAIQFDHGDASGVITLWDGSQIAFEGIERIERI
ncbi:MAG: calcium-binding protein [Magnetococcales bacterium]|nr:calcium-binding protein [Magnetococcales bacterium]